MILACDTSSVVCSVATAHEGEIIFNREASGGQIHIEKLSPFLKEALTDSRSRKIPVQALAIAIGPGSFNGLRIGLATMKALALTLDLPLMPILTTDAMAFGLRHRLKGLCRAVIFSHRNFVHYADYQLGESGLITTPEFHYDTWDTLANKQVDHYFGIADRGFEQWLQTDQAAASVQQRFYHQAADAGQVALLAGLRGVNIVTDLDELEPFYNVKYEAKKWVPPSF